MTTAKPSLSLRNTFLAGLVIVVPIVLTAKALWWLFSSLDALARPLAVQIVGQPVPGLGVLTTVVVVWLAGFLFSSGPLSRLLQSVEGVLDAVPLVGTVYGTTKKVLAGFGSPSGNGFKRFVLAQFPGRSMPGFLTSTFSLRGPDGTEQAMCTVYIPTNHLYVGDVVVLPIGHVIETGLSVEDGISMILSAGAAVPAAMAARPVSA